MATSAEEREASQPQTEFVRALTLTDATMLVAGSMIGSGIFIVLRRTRPDVARPYRAIGYPVLPALYILLASAVAVILLLSRTTQAQALSGLVLVLVGFPVSYLWRQAAPPGPVARP